MLFDVDELKAQALAAKFNVPCSDSATRLAREADLILLCTPIKETPKMIREVMLHMKSDSILCEIASLKSRTVEALKKAPDLNIQPLSIHPMFGPDVDGIEGQTIILVPVTDREREESITKELFPNAEVVILNAETHDSYMATILSLSYFVNLVFAKSISIMDFTLLRRLAGTTFTVQFALAQSIVEESPELVESLINENMFAGETINRFIDESRYIRRLLKKDSQDIQVFCETLQAAMRSTGSDGRRMRRELFKALRMKS